MKNKFLRLFTSMFFFVGCSDKSANTTTGNPLVGLAMTGSSSVSTVLHRHQFKFLDIFISRAFAYTPPFSMFDLNGNSVTLQKTWINVGEIEFKTSEVPETSEIDGLEVSFQGPYAIDLFASTPQILGLNSLSMSAVRRIKVKLIKATSLSSGAPAELTGSSIFISGQVNGVNFSFSTTEESEMQISGAQGINPQNNKTLLLELKTANLIKKINLSSITTATIIDDSNRATTMSNPCPLIDSSAQDIFTCFRKGLETESNLGRDDDGNFRLDTHEESVK
jgi:hypothetical protein